MIKEERLVVIIVVWVHVWVRRVPYFTFFSKTKTIENCKLHVPSFSPQAESKCFLKLLYTLLPIVFRYDSSWKKKKEKKKQKTQPIYNSKTLTVSILACQKSFPIKKVTNYVWESSFGAEPFLFLKRLKHLWSHQTIENWSRKKSIST